jgi:hypothetical protein
VKRTSRSKVERIMIKILRSNSVREGNTKRGTCGARRSGEWENTYAKQKYTPVSSRARGVYNVSLFFLLIIGFKELEYNNS